MKGIATVLLCLMCTTAAVGENRDTLRVMFWNLENLFDFTDSGSGGSDADFSATGSRRWSRKRFYTKVNSVAKTILWAGESHGGRMPAAVGFAEVENAFAVRQIMLAPAFRAYDIGYVHYDSPDPRGIDVALIYDRSQLRLLRSVPHPVNGGTTRDILEAEFLTVKGDTLTLLVNHHPSKYGGASSEALRRGAMETLAEICRSCRHPVIAMGDFNDTPDAPAFSLLDGILVNKASGLHAKGEGTIRFDGRWELIDMFMTSPDLAACADMTIPTSPFLLVKDSAHSGYKPLRTYSGPRYTGGVSDHLPILLDIPICFVH